ncbi:CapA family protein [Adhaeribacter soli]|uniref:CapA family protein n=1 Tax=Adhaeribacter soli TaxID=2607655 RepID=A0A5N1J426_9BACT|nr:CapA family protein [Adhaeribacter soli]KAA9345656.1 CapA family protein [Adhaeribacter soli]
MEQQRILIGLAGDVMIGRGVSNSIAHTNYRYLWGNVLPLLKSTDLNIGNLETTLTHCTKKVLKVFNFRSEPLHVNALLEANFQLVNVANNHILDFGQDGMEDTLKTLNVAGIKHTGAGRNLAEATAPAFSEVKGLKLGMLGFTDNEPTWKAGPDSGGINYLNPENEEDRNTALADIRRLRPEVDFLVVSIHWGPNMREQPPAHFQAFAREMVQNGADLIHGHSAHIFQGIELFENRLILYDTGDFIDDYVVDSRLRNNLSFLYLLELENAKILSLKLVPTCIHNYKVNLAEGSDYEWCMKRVQQLSAVLGTRISHEGIITLS